MLRAPRRFLSPLLPSLLALAACGGENSPATGSGGQGGVPSGGSAGSSAGQTSGASGSAGVGPGGSGSGGVSGSGGSLGGSGASGGGAGGANTAGAGAGTGGGTAGAAGAGGGTEPGYSDPPRDITVQVARGNVSLSFQPSDAAPGATSFHGNAQQARFNAGAAKIQKKLVIGLGGIGTGAHNGGGLGWAADRGYHTMGLDYFNASAGDQGKNYLESWSGEDVGDATVGAANSIMNRVKTGLAYLQRQDPGADWAYYLDAQGNVRWNDVIVFGYSFGGQTGAAGTKYVALHRLVATSAPGIAEQASWATSMPSVTSVKRCFTITGTEDGGHESHLATATRLGWPGQPVETWTSTPPYDGSSLLKVDFGHSEFCSLPTNVLANADAVCEHAFGYSAP